LGIGLFARVLGLYAREPLRGLFVFAIVHQSFFCVYVILNSIRIAVIPRMSDWLRSLQMPTRGTRTIRPFLAPAEAVFHPMVCFHQCMTMLNVAQFWNSLPISYPQCRRENRHSFLAKEDPDVNASHGMP
jgi:hypothetical protein